MEGFQNIALGFATALQPENLLLCLCGVLLGTFIGTYSSIFVAGPLLILFRLRPGALSTEGDDKTAQLPSAAQPSKS